MMQTNMDWQPTSSAFLDHSKPHSRPIFDRFIQLPLEIRTRIWQHAFTPHIIRWIRVNDDATPQSNEFPFTQRPNPITLVCREARHAVHLHAKFVSLGTGQQYSPSHDYLYLDPAWRELDKSLLSHNPFASLSFDYSLIGRIMINPNYTEIRMKPGLDLAKLPNLREVLVVADEKSVGLKDKFMLASVYDLTRYFEAAKRVNPNLKMPYIAVGCLGWVGGSRTRIEHGENETRQLVAVLESQNELKEHLGKMRREEMGFLKKRFSQSSGFKLKFKPGFSMDTPIDLARKVTTSGVKSTDELQHFTTPPRSSEESRHDDEHLDSSNRLLQAPDLPPPPDYA